MARLPARHSPRQNSPLIGKDEPVGPAPTEGSDTYTPAPTVSRAPIPAPPAALALAPTAVNSTLRYSEVDPQRILRTILETKALAPAPQPLGFLHGPCERPLKTRFLELYHGKTQMECYNFF